MPISRYENTGDISIYKVVLITHTYTIAILVVLFVSMLSYFVMYLLIQNLMTTADAYNTLGVTYTNAHAYLLWLMMLSATTLLDLGVTRWSKFE
jgi:hypothetical protein